jgi:hypothetical protein
VTTHFERLGVSPDASEEQISDAYRDLARALHPDSHPNASPDERERFTTQMTEVNQAWEVLKDDDRRAAYRASLQGPAPSVARGPRPPATDECAKCGCWSARPVCFRSQKAWVVGSSVETIELTLCRSCGQALGRDAQNRTMWVGWWGVLAFFRNIAYVIGNARDLSTLEGLRRPRRRDGDVVAPLAEPMDPGRPVWFRSGFLATAALFAILFSLVSQVVDPDWAATSPSTAVEGASGVSWQVGDCVSGDAQVEPISCDASHTGRIIDVNRRSPDLCPARTDRHIVAGGQVWCIDDDR